MTLYDAIKSNPMLVNVPKDLVDSAFISRGYDSTLDYELSKLKEMELISADLYVMIAGTPEIREGDLSLKYDKGLLMARARNIYTKYEDDKLSEVGPTKINVKISKA